jgi:tRNA threonylcarbamoyladenosine biosynthesis protein TsaE
LRTPSHKIKTKSEEQTFRHAADFAKRIKKNLTLILLQGSVGAGKTAWVKGFVFGYLKKKNLVTSSSYSLVNGYQTRDREVIHFDLYRLKNEEDLESVGFWDYLSGKRVVVVEWGEAITNIPPDIDAYLIKFEVLSEKERLLTCFSSRSGNF